MKKALTLALSALAYAPAVLAGGSGSCGGMGYYHGTYVLVKILCFILVSFGFSVIFWWTYLFVVKDKGKLFKKKKK